MGQMEDDNKQLYKQVAGVFGDTVFALLIGMVGLFVLGGVVAVVWDIINKL